MQAKNIKRLGRKFSKMLLLRRFYFQHTNIKNVIISTFLKTVFTLISMNDLIMVWHITAISTRIAK